jgi:hypothetical protein
MSPRGLASAVLLSALIWVGIGMVVLALLRLY